MGFPRGMAFGVGAAAVVLAAALLPHALPAPRQSIPIPAAANPELFPDFPSPTSISVVQVPRESSAAEVLSLVTLQGLVNRRQARAYLDFGGELSDPDSLLWSTIRSRSLAYQPMDTRRFLQLYALEASGLVVVDPARPETVNVATTLAGLRGYVVADPTVAVGLGEQYGLAVVEDLRQPPWNRVPNDIELTEYAFEQLYPSANHDLLTILQPSRVRSRDLAVATSAFTFYLSPGPFAPPRALDALDRILRDTPHNIPLFGWFELSTRAEENAMVQRASRYGKFLTGGEDVPNLSFFAGLGTSNARAPPLEVADAAVEDKVYFTFAVPDGDNLDFVETRMAEMWRNRSRVQVPLAWSVSPLLPELSPARWEHLLETKRPDDAFLAGPSGGGYLYPDFARSEDLGAYLARTRAQLNRSGLEAVWLLNAFTTFETPYREETLAAYVDALRPEALVLDYGDVPVRRDFWMQEGGGTSAPVVRSVHMWGTLENFLGKVSATIDAAPRPHFVFAVVMPWTRSLEDADRAMEFLRERYGDRVEAVSLPRFLSLLRTYLEGRGDERGQQAAAAAPWSAIILLGVVALAAVALARFSRPPPRAQAPGEREQMLVLALHAVILWTALRSVAFSNFWNYYVLASLPLTVVVARRMQGRLEGDAWSVGAAGLAVALLPWTPWAVAPAGLGLAHRALRGRLSPFHLAVIFLAAAAVVEAAYAPWVVALAAAGCLAGTLVWRLPLPAPISPAAANASSAFPLAGALVVFPLVLVTVADNRHLALLRPVSALFLDLAVPLALAAVAVLASLLPTPERRSVAGLFGAWPLLWLATAARDPLLAVLVAIAAAAAGLQILRALPPPPTPRLLAHAYACLALLTALLVMPGIAYSLYLVPLPVASEYIDYVTPLLLAAVAALLAIAYAVWSLAGRREGRQV